MSETKPASPRRRIRPCIIGRDGAGKSWLAATFPKKMLVCLFDAPDKAGEYLKRGVPGDIEQAQHCYFQNVFSASDPERLIIRVEYWGEANPSSPTSYGRFVQRSSTIEAEIVSESYQTVVLDSVTAFELAARFYSEYRANATNADNRAHYNFSMHACEQFVMTRWPNLVFANAIVIAHYDEQKDETDSGLAVSRKMIAVPGKLPNRIGTQFSEMWRVYQDDAGGRHVQTQPRPSPNNFACKTAIGFEDGVYPHYEALWKSVKQNDKPLLAAQNTPTEKPSMEGGSNGDVELQPTAAAAV